MRFEFRNGRSRERQYVRQVIAGIARGELLPEDELLTLQELTTHTAMAPSEAESACKTLLATGKVESRAGKYFVAKGRA